MKANLIFIVLFSFAAKAVYTQSVPVELQCTGLQEVVDCIETTDGYYIKKIGKGPGYYKTDKNFKVLKFYPFTDVADEIEDQEKKYKELGNSFYILGAQENKKEGTLDFYRVSLEKPEEVKVFHSEKAKLKGQKGWKDLVLPKGYEERIVPPGVYLDYAVSPDGQKIVMVWIDPASTNLNYTIHVFDTEFKLLASHRAETGGSFIPNDKNKLKCELDASGDLMLLYTAFEGDHTYYTNYQLNTKQVNTRKMEVPEGFMAPRMFVDKKNNKLCVLFSAKFAKPTAAFKPAGMDLQADIARFCMYDFATGNKVKDIGIKLTQQEIDSLEQGGNLKRKMKDPMYIAAKEGYVFDNGNYGLIFDMCTYSEFTDENKRPIGGGTTVITSSTLTVKGDNSYVLRVYSNAGEPVTGVTLYRTRQRAGLVSNLYFLDNRLWVFCKTERAGEDLNAEAGKDKQMITGYRADETGRVAHMRYALDKEIDFEMGLWDNLTTGLVALSDKRNQHALCFLKLGK
ncbi:MAG: hypothetical protein V4615_02360 [Bacteroidota bacterium]